MEQLREQMKVKIYEKSKNLQKTFRSFDRDHSGMPSLDCPRKGRDGAIRWAHTCHGWTNERDRLSEQGRVPGRGAVLSFCGDGRNDRCAVSTGQRRMCAPTLRNPAVVFVRDVTVCVVGRACCGGADDVGWFGFVELLGVRRLPDD